MLLIYEDCHGLLTLILCLSYFCPINEAFLCDEKQVFGYCQVLMKRHQEYSDQQDNTETTNLLFRSISLRNFHFVTQPICFIKYIKLVIRKIKASVR